MNPVADDIWERSEPVKLGLIELDHRMTVVRLATGGLWIHSPVPLSAELRHELDALGPVTDLVAPSTFHDLFMDDWIAAFPEARLHAAAGLDREHGDWPIAEELAPGAAPDWGDELEGLGLEGMPKINETVVLHRPSRTLIVADLVFNYAGCQPPALTSLVLRMMGTRHELAASRFYKRFIDDDTALRRSLDRVLGWDFERIIVGHGRPVEQDGLERLRRAWTFLHT